MKPNVDRSSTTSSDSRRGQQLGERLDLIVALRRAAAALDGHPATVPLGSRQTRPRGPGYSSTSSISVPNDVLGWMNATVVPREPGLGAHRRSPVRPVLDRLQRGRAVGHPVADVVQALTPLLEEDFETGESSLVGVSSWM